MDNNLLFGRLLNDVNHLKVNYNDNYHRQITIIVTSTLYSPNLHEKIVIFLINLQSL